jgi:hypothetical protein
LTRRQFSGAKITDSLDKEAASTIKIARLDICPSGSGKGPCPYIDLNAKSKEYVTRIGQAAAEKYNLKEGDRTHLNKHGSDVFGRLVADLIVEKIPSLASAFKKDERLSGLIKAGKPA